MEIRELANIINHKLLKVSDVYDKFQNKSGLACPADCGKCCLKSDISCSPYELLPMAFHLIDSGTAEKVLANALQHKGNNCLFLNVLNKDLGTGRCSEYQHRPFVCRAFGLSARMGKYQKAERSLCKTLSDIESGSTTIEIIDDEIPLIDMWKKKLESLSPHLLEKEVPIHEGIVIILEKLLLFKSLVAQS